MIIILILLGIVLICAGLLVLGIKKDYECTAIASGIFGIAFLVAVSVCSVIAGITHGPHHNEQIGAELEQKATALHVEYERLLKDPEGEPYEIFRYNKEAGAFKGDLAKKKKENENPWISWFCTPVYVTWSDKVNDKDGEYYIDYIRVTEVIYGR